jgi:hypothetical protein
MTCGARGKEYLFQKGINIIFGPKYRLLLTVWLITDVRSGDVFSKHPRSYLSGVKEIVRSKSISKRNLADPYRSGSANQLQTVQVNLSS